MLFICGWLSGTFFVINLCVIMKFARDICHLEIEKGPLNFGNEVPLDITNFKSILTEKYVNQPFQHKRLVIMRFSFQFKVSNKI